MINVLCFNALCSSVYNIQIEKYSSENVMIIQKDTIGTKMYNLERFSDMSKT